MMARPAEFQDLPAALPRQSALPSADPSTLTFLQQDGSPCFHLAGQKPTSELIFPRACSMQAGEEGGQGGSMMERGHRF